MDVVGSKWFTGPMIVGCAGMEASSFGLEPVDCSTGNMGRKCEVIPPSSFEEVEAGLMKLLGLTAAQQPAAAELCAAYAEKASAHRSGRATPVAVAPANLWHELTRDLTYGLFVSRLADAHAETQPKTFAYRSDRHVLRTEDPHHSLETSNTFGKFAAVRANPEASLTACVQGKSRRLLPEEIDDEAVGLEEVYMSCWGRFAWRSDPNLAADGPISGASVSAVGEERWPERGEGGGGSCRVFDTPVVRAAVGEEEGRSALPGATLWDWLTKHGLHDNWTAAKARIL